MVLVGGFRCGRTGLDPTPLVLGWADVAGAPDGFNRDIGI